MIVRTFLKFFFILMVLAPAAAWAAPGDPDATFGGDGIVQTVFAVTSRASDVKFQDDGKIVVVGGADDGAGIQFVVVRYNADGSLDDTFGEGGIALTDVVPGESSRAQSLNIQGDGSLIVAGVSSFNNFTVVRYSPEGVLDPGFLFSLPGVDPSDSLGGMDVRPDSRIVLGGTKSMAMAALQLSAAGVLDPDFGTAGLATAPVGAGRGMALQEDGAVVVAGGAAGDFVITRFDADGNQDLSFNGGAGFLQQSLVPGTDFANAVAVQADGKIVGAGLTLSASNDMGVLRLAADGALDTTFNGTGFRVESVAADADFASGLAIQEDAKIVVVGQAYEGLEGAFGVLRLNADGSLDDGFSGDGKTRIPAGLNAEATNVAVDDMGRLVIVGEADAQFTVVRLAGDFADLSVVLSADPAAVENGDPVTLMATVANGSTVPVGGVRLSAQIPAGLALEETAPACAGTSELDCALGLLAAGGSATVTIEIRANAAGTFSPQVTVSGQVTDTDPANNAAGVSVTVTEPSASSSGGCSLWR